MRAVAAGDHQGILEPAAAAFASTKQQFLCDLQLIKDPLGLEAGKWTRVASSARVVKRAQASLSLKRRCIF